MCMLVCVHRLCLHSLMCGVMPCAMCVISVCTHTIHRYLDEAVCAGEYDEELRLSEVMAIEEEEEKQTILLKIRKQSPPSPRPLPKDGDRNGVVHMKTSDSDDSGDIGHSSIPMRDPGVIDNKQIYDRPLICQIAGNKPETMAAAARHLYELGCVDAVDVNFGCPQRCAQEGNYGSFLLQNDPDLAITIVKAMVAACGGNMPITVKMRVHLEGLQATIATALRFQAAGVSVLCLHGRTNTHSEHEDAADWVAIRAVKMALHIPVIANGSIQSCSDALDCLKYTGADAVMSGTGLLRTPSLFTDFQKRYAASKGKPSNNECMHQATANINSLNCALQEIRDLPNSSELKVGALESTLKPSNDVFNQFKEARNELHEAQATITAEEATGVSARRINTDVATSLRDARRYLTLAEECFKDDLASLEPVPGKHTELAGRYHPAASKVIRDHLLAMLQAHLMDIHMDLWSLLGCAEVCSVRQFRETLNLVEHRLLDSYTSTNNNSVASGNNSNSCISSASATALYSLHQIKFNEFQ